MILFSSFNFALLPCTETLSGDDTDERERLLDIWKWPWHGVNTSSFGCFALFCFHHEGGLQMAGWEILADVIMWQHEKSELTQGPPAVNDMSICLYWCVQRQFTAGQQCGKQNIALRVVNNWLGGKNGSTWGPSPGNLACQAITWKWWLFLIIGCTRCE